MAQQANEAYKAQQDHITQQVAEISRLLRQHENTANLEKVRWSHVADLHNVNVDLTEIIQFLK